jgi:carnitine 3-dehydrogenase
MDRPLLPVNSIRVVGLAGAGSVGTAWAALLLANGYDVVAFDQDPGAGDRLRAGVEAAWPVLGALRDGLGEEPPIDRLRFADSVESMAAASDLVQENVAEALAVKREVIAAIDRGLPPDRLILSSSGGVPPTRLQGFCRYPERLVLGHPFHPAHVIPLVEVMGGDNSSPAAVDLALEFYRRLGKHPIRLRREVVGHLSNRLQFAMLREAIHCLSEGVASANDIDAAVRWGLGPRWALVGPLMTFNLAGGEGGVEQLVERFHDDVELWWDSLGSPKLTPQVCTALFDGVRELRQGISNGDWGRWRDRELIEFLRFRKAHPYLTDAAPANGQA